MEVNTLEESNDSVITEVKLPSPSINSGLFATPRSLSSSGKKFFVGLIIVWVIAASWVGSTQTAKSAFSTNKFNAPFFSMWYGTAWMIILFPLTAPLHFLTKQGNAMELWK